MGIAEIKADQLDQYLLAGFFEFDTKTGKDIFPDPVQDEEDEDAVTDGVSIDDYTIKEIKAYLDEHNIEYDSKANKPELFEKAVANGLGAVSADDVDDTGLDALNDEDEEDEDTDLSDLDEDDEDDEDPDGDDDPDSEE